MEFNKDTLKQARRDPTPATHRAVLSALDVLDKQPVRNPRMHGRVEAAGPGQPLALPRWAVAAAAAAAVVALVAAVPPLRHRAANLMQDLMDRAIPQTDRINPAAVGVAPLPSAPTPTANPNSAFLHYGEPYKVLATISTFPNISQTVNGITVTVDEAALTVDRLFLVLHIDNAPKISNLWPTGEVILGGQGTAYSLEGDCKEFNLCAGLPKLIREPGSELPVRFSFDIDDQSSDDPVNLGTFSLSFAVHMGDTVLKLNDNNGMLPYPSGEASLTEAIPTEPTAAVTQTPSTTDLSQATAAAEITALPSSELPTPRPSSNEPATTAMPSPAPQTTAPSIIMPDVTWVPPAVGGADTKALSAASADLPEIAGTTYHESAQFNTGIILEMPDTLTDWDGKAWMNAGMAKNTDLLCGWKGDTGSLYMCVGEYGIQNDLWKAANYVANQWSGEVNGQLYAVSGQQVVLLEDTKGQLACIVLLPCDIPYKMNIPADIVNVNADTITIWGTPAYIHHALKTMRFDSSAVKWISKS